MSLSCFVVRPGGGYRGLVPVALALWSRASSALAEVAWRPTVGDRVVFLDRPELWEGVLSRDGRASQAGRDWRLGPPELFETWMEAGQVLSRYRSVIVDEERHEAVGHYYWTEARSAQAEEDAGDDNTHPG